jgi:hypothetical protein
MADHYLEFSESLTHLSDEQIDWLQNQLETVHVIDGAECTEDNLPDTGDGSNGSWIGCRAYRDMEDYDADFGEDVGFDYAFAEESDEDRGRYLWIYSEENGCVDRVAHLVQKFLRAFRPDRCWSLTYAGTCSKPRVGEFGGGAVFVTATDIKYCNAWGFVEEQEKQFRDGHGQREPTTLPTTLPHAKQYVDAGGAFCPNCRSEQIEGDSVDFDGGHCTQRMGCLECGAVWFDVYTLSSVESRED